MFAQNFVAQHWEMTSHKSRFSDQLLVETENTDLIERVFKNQYILEKILNYTHPDAMNQLKLRLVTKSFCSVILHRIRKQHCKVTIDTVTETIDDSFDGDNSGGSFDQDSTILVNGQRVNEKRVSLYFKFLKTVAKVRVRKLTVEKPTTSSVDERFALHNAIMEKFIQPDYRALEEFVGMSHLCPHGCKKCAMMAESSKIYGPLQMDVVLFFLEKASKFRTLYIDESFLLKLSDKCLQYYSTHEERLNWLNSDITSLFSCDKLVLSLENASGIGRYSEIGGGGNGKLPHSFPREILDIMIQKWKVKSVKLEFKDWDFNTQRYFNFGEYSDDFTKARFDVPFEGTPITTMYFLESLELDLQIFSSIFDSENSFFEADCLDNLIKNARRILPTKNMIVRIPECIHTIKTSNLDTFIPKFMLMAEMERNFNLTFQLLPSYDFKVADILNSGARLLNHSETQEDVFVLERIIDIEDDSNLRGRSFQIENNLTNCTINFDIFLPIRFLERFIIPFEYSGFIRHFWRPKYTL